MSRRVPPPLSLLVQLLLVLLAAFVGSSFGNIDRATPTDSFAWMLDDTGGSSFGIFLHAPLTARRRSSFGTFPLGPLDDAPPVGERQFVRQNGAAPASDTS